MALYSTAPSALSAKIGVQTPRPLAVVVIGGAVSRTPRTRLLHPILVDFLHRRLGLTEEQRAQRHPRTRSRHRTDP